MALQKTPAVSERALQILEIIASAEQPPSLRDLMARTSLPKATIHRFVSLLEMLGFAERSFDGKRYQVGHRLTALAIEVMRTSLARAPRRSILTSLVHEIGETCNITILNGLELIYVDRVESNWPLHIGLGVGSRVPLHCTASGKLFLSLASPSTRNALIRSYPLQRHTARTIVDREELDIELDRIKRSGIGTDNEEFIYGMAAAAGGCRLLELSL